MAWSVILTLTGLESSSRWSPIILSSSEARGFSYLHPEIRNLNSSGARSVDCNISSSCMISTCVILLTRIAIILILIYFRLPLSTVWSLIRSIYSCRREMQHQANHRQTLVHIFVVVQISYTRWRKHRLPLTSGLFFTS